MILGLLRKSGKSSLVRTFQLFLVIGGIEMAFRFSDQSVVVDLPKFVTADPNFVSGAARSGVRSG